MHGKSTGISCVRRSIESTVCANKSHLILQISLTSIRFDFQRYSECGIDVGPIEMIVYVSLLKWVEYKPSETKPYTYELVKHWDDKKWEPAAIQTLIQSCMPEKGEQFKVAKDVIRKTVVLLSNNSKYYGEIATVADAQNLEKNGRVNSK